MPEITVINSFVAVAGSTYAVGGDLYVATPAAPQSFTAGTWSKVTAFDASDSEVTTGVTPDIVNNEITVPISAVYSIAAGPVSFSGTVNSEWEIAIAIDDVIQIKGAANRKLGTGGDVGTTCAGGLYYLVAGEKVSLWLKPVADADVNIESATLSVFSKMDKSSFLWQVSDYSPVTDTYYIRANPSGVLTKQLRNSGSVKIDRNGDSSEPTFTGFVADVPQQILYTNPILDSETYFPETAPVKNSTSIYAPSVTVGATPYEGIFLENPVLGQQQTWRISLSYSGKPPNTAVGLKVLLINPISGFTRTLLVTLPESDTEDTFLTTEVSTYHDINSAADPVGTGTGGYQLFLKSTITDLNFEVTVKDIARLLPQH